MVINSGDTIQWIWDTPNEYADINYQVEQVEDASSKIHVENGFTSGSPSSKGKFFDKLKNINIYVFLTL